MPTAEASKVELAKNCRGLAIHVHVYARKDRTAGTRREVEFDAKTLFARADTPRICGDLHGMLGVVSVSTSS